MGREKYEVGSLSFDRLGPMEEVIHGANCCNCWAFFFIWWVIFAPFTVWYNGAQSGVRTQIGTGPWVVSMNSRTFDCGWHCTGILSHQWIYWSELNSADACSNSTNIYRDWSGKYGFCDKIGGTFDTTGEIKALQAFSVLSVLFLVMALAVGCSVRVTKSKGVYAAACFSFLCMISSIAAFSIVAVESNSWYNDLLRNPNGGSMPFFIGGQLVATTGFRLSYGPSFGMWIAAFIITLISSTMFCFAAKTIDAELEDISNSDFNLEAED